MKISSSHEVQLALVQMNPVVGAIKKNLLQIKTHVETCSEINSGPLVILFSELCVTGYPPEDLLFRDDFLKEVSRGIEELQTFSLSFPEVLLVIGAPISTVGGLKNAGIAIHNGDIIATHYKVELPNYQVFDEKRYFTPGSGATVFSWYGVTFAISVCEDIWFESVFAQSARHGAEVMLNLNGSPFHQGKTGLRYSIVRERQLEARALGREMAVAYANQVGGQDELIFDGGSFFVNASGEEAMRLPIFQPALGLVQLKSEGDWSQVHLEPLGVSAPTQPDVFNTITQRHYLNLFQALVLGTKDYVRKNGFERVVLGLSGGIDSALTLAIAVAALGPDAVTAVALPYKYTAQVSLELAALQSQNLGVQYLVRPIEPIYSSVTQVLADDLGSTPDETEENIQARCRALVLMAISNKSGALVLTTGNKSELSVGYATLYGDMVGGFAPIKDLFKTQVYELAGFINSSAIELGFSTQDVIPEGVIHRPPTAELRPGQLDQDSLPAYAILDEILQRFVEYDQSEAHIIASGFDEADVVDVVAKVKRNEYKRRQAAPGVRVSARAFGRDRRYPITAQW